MTDWNNRLKAIFRADLEGDPEPLRIVSEQISAMERELESLKTPPEVKPLYIGYATSEGKLFAKLWRDERKPDEIKEAMPPKASAVSINKISVVRNEIVVESVQ